MTKGFAYWFGQLDLNNPADEEDVFGNQDDGAGTSAAHDGNQQDVPASSGAPTSEEGQNVSDQPPVPSHSTVPYHSAHATHSGARTGVTLSSEDSGSDEEVQSTPEGFVPKTPFVGMVFDTLEAALADYNRYVHHIDFSVKIESSRKSAIDGVEDKSVFVCRIMQIMSELYGGKANVLYDAKTVSNYTTKLGEPDKFRDIPSLLDYFEEIKQTDPMFYYKFKLDDESRVQNIFWVDGPAREVYKIYYDRISFDTTYLTNRYKIPCAPFIGINRYCQSIQLGCGFLRHERIEDFVWLFEVFLDAMDGLHPENIIIDQCGSMRSAIMSLLPNCCYRNCHRHIVQKVQEKVGPMVAKNEDLRREFNEVIDYSVTVEEFEINWAEMLVKHDLVDNPHFLDIYDIRESFVPMYFKNRFFPFLQTTARSEGFNAVLKQYVELVTICSASSSNT
ncbi:hypothetical protein ACQ4PT_039493 [Festuca glaucescens]